MITMKKIILSLLSLSSAFASAEVHFYNEHTIAEIKFKEQQSYDYFDVLKCGSYHCYGQKGSTLYSIGFNGQGQLGLNNRESQKDWSITMENIKYFKIYDYSGCLKTTADKYFRTGAFWDNKDDHFSNKILKWQETSRCK